MQCSLGEMDVTAFVVLILCCVGQSFQFPQQDLQALDVTTESSNINANNANITEACETARGLNGSCVDRQYCEYSISNIDLSLYAPKGYKKTCGDKETCCPLSYQIQVETIKDNNWQGFEEEQ